METGKGVALVLCAALSAFEADAQVPDLVYETSPNLTHLAIRLQRIDPARLERAAELVGAPPRQEKINVFLAAENTELAQSVPPWISGYALASRSAIVIFPARVPSYPSSNLEEVLLHELAHVLIARTAGQHPVPRWLNEGLALIAGGPWGLADRSHLTLAMLSDSGVRLSDLEAMFTGSRTSVRRAYALSGAFTQNLLQRHGPDTGARILRGLGDNLSIEEAFQRATGSQLQQAEDSFWRRYKLLYRWLPVLTSGATLWIGITFLALLAIRRRRRRDAEIRRRWEEEESRLLPVDDSPDEAVN